MNKKGFGHIEMILAFIIFVAAVVFALTFFNPGNNDRAGKSLVEYAFNELSENASTNINSYSLIVYPSSLQEVIAINLSIPENFGVSVQDAQGNIFNSSKSDFLYIEPTDERIFTTVVGEDVSQINSQDISSVPFNAESYKIASSSSEKVFSEKRILLLREAYLSDYNSLKESFNLGRANLGFSIIFSDNTKIEASKDELAGSVLAEKRQIKILRLNNKIESAELIIKIW